MSGRQTITGIDPATREGLALDIEGERIVGKRPEPNPQGGFLSAGLIDLQVNGYGGIDLNTPGFSTSDVAGLCDKLVALGVTTFLPTVITASESSIVSALATIANARREFKHVAQMVPAAHVEGPSISPEDGPRGAHPRQDIRAPSLAEFARWQAASDDLVGLVTLAPEHLRAEDYIRSLVAQGVLVSLGHTAANPDQIHAAAAAGACLSTHLGNGVAASLPRHPNMIWAQLADDRLSIMLIADGFHLPPDTFKVMVKAKGPESVILVSDTVALAGMAPGLYEQRIGGRVEVSADGRIAIAATPYLAGAGLPLSAGVAMAAGMADIGIADALVMATRTPGRLLGGIGKLEPGQRADIIRFHWSAGARALRIEETWLAGERWYRQ